MTALPPLARQSRMIFASTDEAALALEESAALATNAQLSRCFRTAVRAMYQAAHIPAHEHDDRAALAELEDMVRRGESVRAAAKAAAATRCMNETAISTMAERLRRKYRKSCGTGGDVPRETGNGAGVPTPKKD